MLDTNGDDATTHAPFARSLYSREQTQSLPTATAEPDAPVNFVRSTVELSPSASHPAAAPVDLDEWHDRMCRRELVQRLTAQLDDVRSMEVRIFGDCAVLRGYVSCPLARLLAEDIAYSMPEIWDCHNLLEVRSAAPSESAAA